MKKIPTLFQRTFENHNVVEIRNEITPGLEWVLNREGEATIKIDGSCCAIINELFYKRFDAKPGRKIPDDAIPCCAPDPITNHWPHWVPVDFNSPADRWFAEAWKNTLIIEPYEHTIGLRTLREIKNGTFEAIGPHFKANPYHLDKDILVPHGIWEIDVERSFEGIKEYLKNHEIEGIVFWRDGEPKCKIKRSDFGFNWPTSNPTLPADA